MSDEAMKNGWPLVVADDDGIRPAGDPDTCFYCRARIGTPHERECVVVTKRVEMLVRARFAKNEPEVTGTWQTDEPYSWDANMCEFHKNESSWCAGSLLDEERLGTVAWNASNVWEKLRALDRAGTDLCSVLRFEFLRVIDDTPRRARKKAATS